MLAELRCSYSTAAPTTPLHIASILPCRRGLVKHKREAGDCGLHNYGI